VQGAKQIEQFADSRKALEADGIETKARVSQEGSVLVEKADILSVDIRDCLESQQASMQSRLADWSSKTLQGHEQAQTRQTAMAGLFAQTSDHTITALKDLSLRTTASVAEMEAVYNRTSEDVRFFCEYVDVRIRTLFCGCEC
jgi:hypothetical protein